MCIAITIGGLFLIALGLVAYAIRSHEQARYARIRRFDPTVTDEEIRDELGRTP